MYTEDEAKKKWCPHSIAMHAGGQCGNRDAENNSSEWPNGHHPATMKQTSCIGSACMAWRPLERLWIDPDKPGIRYASNHSGELQQEPARGFCGLSGAPS